MTGFIFVALIFKFTQFKRMKIISSTRGQHHQNSDQHPECPDRLTRLQSLFKRDYPQYLLSDYKKRNLSELPDIHDTLHLKNLINKATAYSTEHKYKYHSLDSDTAISSGTLESLEDAFGAITIACDNLITKQSNRLFCATRPPGHHAEYNKAMGFCFINWAYLSAHILSSDKSSKVLIIDFDVHHGNGTQNLIENHFRAQSQNNIFYASLHESPLFPGTGEIIQSKIASTQILNLPYPPNTKSSYFRELFTNKLLPFINQIKPDFFIISAGFDAHMDDPLSTAKLIEDDFEWIATQLNQYDLPMLSILEGGYNLDALENCVTAYLDAFFNL
jgi:acetoin utilization deacetylase AcuC-like enzyme